MNSIQATAEPERARLLAQPLPREVVPAILTVQAVTPVRRRPSAPGDPRRRLGKLDPEHPLMGPPPTD